MSLGSVWSIDGCTITISVPMSGLYCVLSGWVADGRCVVDRRVYHHDHCIFGVVFVIEAISSVWAYHHGFVFMWFIVALSCYSGGGVGDVSKGEQEHEW